MPTSSTPWPSTTPSSFWRPAVIFPLATLLRLLLLIYGSWQDTHSPVRYTDIDYYVFTDASSYVRHGHSPYSRETYRYTPLLAWLLLPTSWPGGVWFSSGKVLFAAADIVAGMFLLLVLRSKDGGLGMGMERSCRFASIWLLNPMVANISTRGSSEALLAVMVTALLWSIIRSQIVLAGLLLGLSVHFKIYPFIYALSLLLYLQAPPAKAGQPFSPIAWAQRFLNRPCLTLGAASLTTFLALNALMYALHGHPFLQHTYLHHATRIDHRHNFSPYNILLYLSSSQQPSTSSIRFESLAFLPQLGLSAVLLPLVLAKKDLASAMLAQTWAFVALNKVCTAQYFLWYLVLLPLYLPHSSFLERPKFGLLALGLWVSAQVVWLQQGYELEFLGKSTFVPGLWGSGLAFYVVNMWILGVIVGDVGRKGGRAAGVVKKKVVTKS
jgi:phosphatidylinositol glycan class M